MNPEVPAKKTKDDFILEKLAQSGYPLEICISSIISSNDEWEVFPNQYYFDEDIKTSREIDIKASSIVDAILIRRGRKDPLLPAINLSMFIECKKSGGNAWVFFRTPLPTEQISELRQIKVFSSFDVIDIRRPFEIQMMCKVDGTHFDKCEVVSTAYEEIDIPNGKDTHKPDRRTDNIYKAAFSLIKAINYEISISKIKGKKSIETQFYYGNTPQFVFVDIFYPVIVVEGDLYEAIMKDGDGSSIKKRQYIQLIVSYGDEHYTIDVVSKDHFSEYFRQINEDLTKFLERIDANAAKLLDEYHNEVLTWNENRLNKLPPDHSLSSVR